MNALLDQIRAFEPCLATGFVTSVRGALITASGPPLRVGDLCDIGAPSATGRPLLGEVIAMDAESVRIVPLGEVSAINVGDRITRSNIGRSSPSLAAVTRRAINALGEAADGGPGIKPDFRTRPADCAERTINPTKAFTSGIRAIDGLLPLAQGQRIGIFAPSGAGKTTLVEQLARFGECDRIILCQIGERGREIEKAWQMLSNAKSIAPFTLVSAKASESASMRVRALSLALSLAEQARREGEHVLLVVDSITRVAMALRELGLAAGEPPAARGYTSNVYALLPAQIERCGAIEGGGAITGICTVLSETEDVDDPLVEMMKSVLDGHIVLSRSLAERRHFPAIDITRSVSRLAQDVYADGQEALADRVHRTKAIFDEAQMMIESGLYKSGSSANIDRAVIAKQHIDRFLRQSLTEKVGRQETLAALRLIAEKCCDD